MATASPTETSKPKREHMELIGANAEAFLQALDEPPEPNERLVEAVRRYRAMVG